MIKYGNPARSTIAARMKSLRRKRNVSRSKSDKVMKAAKLGIAHINWRTLNWNNRKYADASEALRYWRQFILNHPRLVAKIRDPEGKQVLRYQKIANYTRRKSLLGDELEEQMLYYGLSYNAELQAEFLQWMKKRFPKWSQPKKRKP